MTGEFRISYITKPRRKSEGIVSTLVFAYLIAIRNSEPEDYKALQALLDKIWEDYKT